MTAAAMRSAAVRHDAFLSSARPRECALGTAGHDLAA
jgi:hypothetical protein